MKRFYTSKLLGFASLACILLLVACGLRIKSVTLSANAIEKNGEVTMTSTLVRQDSEYDNNKNLYLLYAVRVPQDWTTASALDVINHFTANETIQLSQKFEFEDSPAYAALCEFSFPKAGYKWIAFQTKEAIEELVVNQNDYDDVVATLTLKAGDAEGNFDLAVASGSFYKDPSVLLNADGSLNVDEAFGHKTDGNKADSKKTSVSETEVFGFSEYLMNATTISPAELTAREDALLNVTATVDGVTLPISPLDIGNKLTDEEIAQLQLNVKVGNPDAAVENLSAEGVSVKAQGGKIVVTAPEAVATVYNAVGVKVDSRKVNGEAVLDVQKGVNVVEVSCNGKRLVKKFMVK